MPRDSVASARDSAAASCLYSEAVELKHKQNRLARISQARKGTEAETAAAAARQRQKEAQNARAKATEAEEADASD